MYLIFHSSDYQGSYLSEEQSEPLPPQGSYISDGRYVEITKKGYSTWSNFDWKYRNKTDNLYKKKFQAKGRYQHQNGATYFSLYDADGKWYGYVNSKATAVLNGPQGNYISDGRFVSITKDNYSVWSNFEFKSIRAKTDTMYQKTYQARGRYEHFDGSIYYSIFDNKGKWLGYLNSKATKNSPNRGGIYIADSRYVTVNKKGYDAWRNFSWKIQNKAEDVFEKTYLAKGRYEHFGGSTFLTLYDENNVWQGYVNQTATKTASGPQGIYMSDIHYATVTSKNKNFYNNFNWKIKIATNDIYHKTYKASAKYNHMNGQTYYSLYDAKNNWQGYAEGGAVTLSEGAQGIYIHDGNTVVVTKGNYTIWNSFTFNKARYKTVNLVGKEYIAKAHYEHSNGSVYYSLFDKNNKWMGYLNADATKIVK